jgi:quercetin dioxygenase-like cupin family protein
MSVVRGNETEWRALEVPGVSVRILRSDKATGESTALVRLEPGSRFPAHDHPAGEEVYVVEGEVTIGGERLNAGDYLYTPPSGKHAASTEGGCVFLVTLPKPVVILKD